MLSKVFFKIELFMIWSTEIPLNSCTELALVLLAFSQINFMTSLLVNLS